MDNENIGSERRRAGLLVQSGRTSLFPVPVLRTGRTAMFFLEVNEPARPSGGPARVMGRRAPGEGTWNVMDWNLEIGVHDRSCSG